MLKDRWRSFCARLGASGDPDAVFDGIADRYGEAHRAYHTLDHIAFCLKVFDACRHLAVDPDAVEAAIWFHDTVHDPDAHDNERRSADLARGTLGELLRVDPSIVRKTERLIMATAHGPLPDDPDAALLADIDLTVLGGTKAEFDEYELAVRKEYAHVSDADYRGGRLAVLNLFFSREHVYATKHFRTRYGGQARSNLRRAILRLREDPS